MPNVMYGLNVRVFSPYAKSRFTGPTGERQRAPTPAPEYKLFCDQRLAAVPAALFYDAGTAANRWSQKSLYSGAGVGARWRSPVGPVNLDLAYGLKTRTFRP